MLNLSEGIACHLNDLRGNERLRPLAQIRRPRINASIKESFERPAGLTGPTRCLIIGVRKDTVFRNRLSNLLEGLLVPWTTRRTNRWKTHLL